MTNSMSRFIVGFFLLLLTLESCDDNDSEASFNISNNVEISVVNEAGEDLLNPDHSSAIAVGQIKVYYELDGLKQEINRTNMDYPRMFALREPTPKNNRYSILLYLNTEDDSNPTTTFLEWNSNRTDVFKSSLISSDESFKSDKIWLNGRLVCEDTGNCKVTITMK